MGILQLGYGPVRECGMNVKDRRGNINKCCGQQKSHPTCMHSTLQCIYIVQSVVVVKGRAAMDPSSGWLTRKKLQFELYTSLYMVEPTEKIAFCIQHNLFCIVFLYSLSNWAWQFGCQAF